MWIGVRRRIGVSLDDHICGVLVRTPAGSRSGTGETAGPILARHCHSLAHGGRVDRRTGPQTDFAQSTANLGDRSIFSVGPLFILAPGGLGRSAEISVAVAAHPGRVSDD